jgi:hypothetical protein
MKEKAKDNRERENGQVHHNVKRRIDSKGPIVDDNVKLKTIEIEKCMCVWLGVWYGCGIYTFLKTSSD